jgi:hypothetical protein
MVALRVRMVAATDRLKAVQEILGKANAAEELDRISPRVALAEIAEIVSDYTCPTLNVQFSATPQVRLTAIENHVTRGLTCPVAPWDKKAKIMEEALAEIVRWSTVNYGSQ